MESKKYFAESLSSSYHGLVLRAHLVEYFNKQIVGSPIIPLLVLSHYLHALFNCLFIALSSLKKPFCIGEPGVEVLLVSFQLVEES